MTIKHRFLNTNILFNIRNFFRKFLVQFLISLGISLVLGIFYFAYEYEQSRITNIVDNKPQIIIDRGYGVTNYITTEYKIVKIGNDLKISFTNPEDTRLSSTADFDSVKTYTVIK